jgi:hypothetical protein
LIKTEKSSFVQTVSNSAQTRFSFTAVSPNQFDGRPVCWGRAAVSVKPTGRGIFPHGNKTVHNSTNPPFVHAYVRKGCRFRQPRCVSEPFIGSPKACLCYPLRISLKHAVQPSIGAALAVKRLPSTPTLILRIWRCPSVHGYRCRR